MKTEPLPGEKVELLSLTEYMYLQSNPNLEKGEGEALSIPGKPAS